ncbi:uncharacterized protein ARMOST_06569 [Armillaria ostoyae]|uniref:Uncharacterized protein n=1 Tax=Armillaria ostoyae TaxID=47428 RepID=A0A284R3C9_ARMOS|nr:uncharacterized protein ARMOST_06569 [Armillaria ostoyae]
MAAARSSGTPSPTPPTRSSPSSQAKRRRRAPSPTIWIPYSLRAYNVVLSGHVSCPALPVSPSAYDERDSYDSQVGVNPYHPKDWAWKPRLPGPAVILGVGFGVGLKEEWEESAGMGLSDVVSLLAMLYFGWIGIFLVSFHLGHGVRNLYPFYIASHCTLEDDHSPPNGSSLNSGH